MKTRGSHGDCFAVCDFCDADSSASNVKWVLAVGDKGLCNICAKAIGGLIRAAEEARRA